MRCCVHARSAIPLSVSLNLLMTRPSTIYAVFCATFVVALFTLISRAVSFIAWLEILSDAVHRSAARLSAPLYSAPRTALRFPKNKLTARRKLARPGTILSSPQANDNNTPRSTRNTHKKKIHSRAAGGGVHPTLVIPLPSPVVFVEPPLSCAVVVIDS